MKKEYLFFSEVIERGHSREKLIGLGKKGALSFYVYFHGGVAGETTLWEGLMLPGPYRIDIPRFCFVLMGRPIDRLYLPWKIEPPERAFRHGEGESMYKLKTPAIFSESDLVLMTYDLECLVLPTSDQGAPVTEPPQQAGLAETTETINDVIAVGWKKRKRTGGLLSIEDATGMSEQTVRKYAATLDENFLRVRTRETGNGKKAIHLTQIDVNKIIAAKKNY